MRVEAGKWWECEMPNMDEMREGVKNLREVDMKVDYIVTHEPAPRVTYSTVNPKENTNQLEAF